MKERKKDREHESCCAKLIRTAAPIAAMLSCVKRTGSKRLENIHFTFLRCQFFTEGEPECEANVHAAHQNELPLDYSLCLVLYSLVYVGACVCVYKPPQHISSHVCFWCLCLCVWLCDIKSWCKRFNAALCRGADCRSAGAPRLQSTWRSPWSSRYPISLVINHCPVTQQEASLYVPEACRAIKALSSHILQYCM